MRKESKVAMQTSSFPLRSRVQVTSYGPFRGLKGIIQSVDTIVDDLEEPFCFYLVALDGTTIREPIWFAYDEVELMDSPLGSPQSRIELASIGSL